MELSSFLPPGACRKWDLKGRPRLGFERPYGGFVTSTKSLTFLSLQSEKTAFLPKMDRNSGKNVFGDGPKEKRGAFFVSLEVLLGS